MRNAGLVWSARSRTQPIPNPMITAETNSLPARKPSDIAEPVALASVLGAGFGSEARGARGPAFQFALQPIEPRTQRRGLIVGISGVRTHGAKPSLERNTRRAVLFNAPPFACSCLASKRDAPLAPLDPRRRLGQGRPPLDPNGLRMPKSPPPPRADKGRRNAQGAASAKNRQGARNTKSAAASPGLASRPASPLPAFWPPLRIGRVSWRERPSWSRRTSRCSSASTSAKRRAS